MSRPTISATDIPQADSLEKVRRVVSAVARQGARIAGDLVQATGMSPRQVQYAIRAAITLGWLERSDQGLLPTTASDALLAIPEGRAAERALLRDLLSSNEILRAVVPDLLANRPPSPVALGARIAAMTGLAPATAERRAGTLLRWRHEVLGEAVPAATARRKRGSAPQMALPLFAVQAIELAEPLVRDIMRDNPWWRGEASRPLPPHPRRFTSLIHKRLRNRLAPVVVVRGPRQVGKTTAQLQVIEDLLGRGIPRRPILRVQFDELPSLGDLEEPILRIVEWYETHVLGETLNSAATAGRPVYLFFDELQNLDGWAIQLKHLVDGSLVQVVVTGSSALRIEEGRDSLAGRITTIEVGTLSLAEISTIPGQVPSAD